MKFKKRGYCLIALAVCAAMLVPTVSSLATANGKAGKNIKQQKASLKSQATETQKDEKAEKNNYDEYKDYDIKGYSKDEVAEAKMFVERVNYQLQEITGETDNSPENPTADILKQDPAKSKAEDDLQDYKDLQQKIDTKKAVSFLVKLKKEFNGLEGVFDEYLFSLQAGIDFEKYSKDKKEYQKEKKEKSLGLDTTKLITTSKIENKMLEIIQKRNQKKVDDAVKKTENSKIGDIKADAGVPGLSKSDDNKIEAPVSDVNKIKPDNPLDGINKEVNDIKNQSFGIESEKTNNSWGMNNEKK